MTLTPRRHVGLSVNYNPPSPSHSTVGWLTGFLSIQRVVANTNLLGYIDNRAVVDDPHRHSITREATGGRASDLPSRDFPVGH